MNLYEEMDEERQLKISVHRVADTFFINQKNELGHWDSIALNPIQASKVADAILDDGLLAA